MISSVFLYLVSKGKILFGIFFMAPVLSQLLSYSNIEIIFGFPNIIPCLVVGFFWGLYANIKGQWF
ncbi:MAG: hypothetical protein CML82_01890 [Rhodobiaceae bacterium]|jgi:hypothetical protein|nr:hypothetical protein [Rhodobiaceae bacterium]|tara:strand:- start:4599 stop:4796 length:198 start_codon:yes stop_codon:yes gene_type:complete